MQKHGKIDVDKFIISYCLWAMLSFIGCQSKSQQELGTEASLQVKIEGMVLIPSGIFLMGGNDDLANPNEFPRHKVKVSAFWMDEHEVTNKQFLEFVSETGYITVAERRINWKKLAKGIPPGSPKPPDSLLAPGSLVFTKTNQPVPMDNPALWWKWKKGANWRNPKGPESDISKIMNHSAVHIAWEDANAYAIWAGKRLPTEAEWEWASRGGLNDPIYPWGNSPASKSSSKANFWQGLFPFSNEALDGFPETSPVKSFPPNGYGLYDMAGNVWEWCSDWYHMNYYNMISDKLATDPQGPLRSYDPVEPFMKKKVLRGGSYLCNDSYCSGYRVSRRMSLSPDTGLSHAGFRCVKD